MREIYGGCLYDPNFIPKEGLEYLEAGLLALDWETKRTARHELFMALSPTDYSYGRDDGIVYTSKSFSTDVLGLGVSVGNVLHDLGMDPDFTACFLNKYDDQHQHLGWHADDFEGMDPNAPISVISFGAEREIWLKEKGEFGIVPTDQRVLLNRGSLFIMPKGFQDTHFHRIPKHSKPCSWRISLTFRKFL